MRPRSRPPPPAAAMFDCWTAALISSCTTTARTRVPWIFPASSAFSGTCTAGAQPAASSESNPKIGTSEARLIMRSCLPRFTLLLSDELDDDGLTRSFQCSRDVHDLLSVPFFERQRPTLLARLKGQTSADELDLAFADPSLADDRIGPVFANSPRCQTPRSAGAAAAITSLRPRA